LELRRAALEHVRELSRRYDDLIPLDALRAGFVVRGDRVSYGSFFSGIFRPKQCRDPAALCIVTAPPKERIAPPYPDEFDEETGRFTYHYRSPAEDTAKARLDAARDNAALRAAHELAVPLIYFRGVAKAQYVAIAPVVVVADRPAAGMVEVQAALPTADTTDRGIVSDEPVRAYATREARIRLHQHQFRINVLRAYSSQCAVCRLRESALLEAAHIIEDRDPEGSASVINGVALCAIHHLAYDRNLMGIDPTGVIHIAHRLLNEIDGPMLRVGLQGFHGESIEQPRRATERPDPDRLEVRFDQFKRVA